MATTIEPFAYIFMKCIRLSCKEVPQFSDYLYAYASAHLLADCEERQIQERAGLMIKRLIMNFSALIPIWLAGVSSLQAADFDCLIEPAQTIELATPVTGTVSRVTVRRGDRVARGQVLATLESSAEQAAATLAQYKSRLEGPTRMAEQKIEFAQRKFKRRKDMAAEKLMPAQEKDDAEAEYMVAQAERVVAVENREVARLEYQQQSSLLALRTLRSPIDGVVVDQLARAGEVVEASGSKKVILKLAQLDPLRVNIVLPKEFFGKPRLGMLVQLVPEIPVRKYTAKVSSIDRLIDAASGTFVVFLSLPNPALDIPAGVKCRASFPDVARTPGQASAVGRK